MKEAIKLFGREDLLSDYGIQDTDTNIEVFMTVKDMIKYYKQYKEIERLNNIINEFEDWLKEKKEQMEEFELYKRKETGAFWYSTMGNIETFIDKIEELKGSDKE